MQSGDFVVDLYIQSGEFVIQSVIPRVNLLPWDSRQSKKIVFLHHSVVLAFRGQAFDRISCTRVAPDLWIFVLLTLLVSILCLWNRVFGATCGVKLRTPLHATKQKIGRDKAHCQPPWLRMTFIMRSSTAWPRRRHPCRSSADNWFNTICQHIVPCITLVFVFFGSLWLPES